MTKRSDTDMQHYIDLVLRRATDEHQRIAKSDLQVMLDAPTAIIERFYARVVVRYVRVCSFVRSFVIQFAFLF